MVVDQQDHEAPVHLYPMRLLGDQLEMGTPQKQPRRDRGAYPAVAARRPDDLYIGRGKTVGRQRPFALVQHTSSP